MCVLFRIFLYIVLKYEWKIKAIQWKQFAKQAAYGTLINTHTYAHVESMRKQIKSSANFLICARDKATQRNAEQTDLKLNFCVKNKKPYAKYKHRTRYSGFVLKTQIQCVHLMGLCDHIGRIPLRNCFFFLAHFFFLSFCQSCDMIILDKK